MNIRQLLLEIEIMREKLHKLLEFYGENSEIVLNCSQELDKLLTKEIKMRTASILSSN